MTMDWVDAAVDMKAGKVRVNPHGTSHRIKDGALQVRATETVWIETFMCRDDIKGKWSIPEDEPASYITASIPPAPTGNAPVSPEEQEMDRMRRKLADAECKRLAQSAIEKANSEIATGFAYTALRELNDGRRSIDAIRRGDAP